MAEIDDRLRSKQAATRAEQSNFVYHGGKGCLDVAQRVGQWMAFEYG